MEIDTEYRPDAVERRWSARGSSRVVPGRSGLGQAAVLHGHPPAQRHGNLHIGHVLVYTLHDVVARWRRMQGRDVLWLPGTDHAGIATQAVVERELAAQNLSRHDLGREAFERRVWEWKEIYGGKITEACGAGLLGGLERERFTLDEACRAPCASCSCGCTSAG